MSQASPEFLRPPSPLIRIIAQRVAEALQDKVPLGILTMFAVACLENGLGSGRCFAYDLCNACPEFRPGWSKYCALLTEGGCEGSCILEHAGHFAKTTANMTTLGGDGRMPTFPQQAMRRIVSIKHNGNKLQLSDR